MQRASFSGPVPCCGHHGSLVASVIFCAARQRHLHSASAKRQLVVSSIRLHSSWSPSSIVGRCWQPLSCASRRSMRVSLSVELTTKAFGLQHNLFWFVTLTRPGRARQNNRYDSDSSCMLQRTKKPALARSAKLPRPRHVRELPKVTPLRAVDHMPHTT